jgi:hypothetical protein
MDEVEAVNEIESGSQLLTNDFDLGFRQTSLLDETREVTVGSILLDEDEAGVPDEGDVE